MSDSEGSLLLGDGLDGLPDSGATLLPVDHNLETLEVVKAGAGSSLGELLGERGGSPLLTDLGGLGSLDKGAGAGTAGDVDLHPGHGKSLQGKDHPGEALGLNENAGLISDVSDNDLLAVVLSVVNESNSAWLNEILVSLHVTKKSCF